MSNREIDLSKPSLAGLSCLLRDPTQWPVGFEWDYGDSGCCAMGLASEYWEVEVNGGYTICDELFGLSRADTEALFYGRGPWYPKEPSTTFVQKVLRPEGWTRMKDVTPEHVADAIDDYLTQQIVDKSKRGFAVATG